MFVFLSDITFSW